jgi:hypothetical protein
MKVSDLVREFITDGLAGGESSKECSAVIEQLTGISDILATLVQ